MSDFNLSVTVRNNHILRRIRAQYGSNSAMCRETGLSKTAVSALLTMRKRPFRKDGTLTSAAEDLCSALGATPSELWPGEMAKVHAKKAKYEIEVSQAEAMAIASSSERDVIHRQLLERWVGGLSPRYLLVLEMYQQGANTDEIAAELGVSRGRAWQMVILAQRKVRDKARQDGIRSFDEVDA